MKPDETDLVIRFLIFRTAFFHFCNIAKIRNTLSQSDDEKIVHASQKFSEKPPADPKCCNQF